MRRRHWLKLGVASAAVLVLAGGAALRVEPGLEGGSLTGAGRRVLGAVARGLLDGTLPAPGAAQAEAIRGLLQRIDALVGALPAHAQAELSQLLALLDTAPGRQLLGGLDTAWETASVERIQVALTSMRGSTLSLRQQAYHALHDITSAAYVSDASTWQHLGYPGPMKI